MDSVSTILTTLDAAITSAGRQYFESTAAATAEIYTTLLALLLVMVVLGVLGYSAYAQRGAAVWVRIVGAIGTALFGFVVFVLNYAVH